MLTKVKPAIKQIINSSSKAFSELQTQQKQGGQVARRQHTQFTKRRLVDFGELPQGEIPEALQVDRAHQLTKLDNGVRVATEHLNSQLATVTVLVRAGSRNETLETSGVSQFISRLVLRGTQSRNREQIEKELNQLGSQVQASVQRETTAFSLTVRKDDVNRAVDLLGDLLSKSLFNKNQIEAERDAVYRNAAESHRDQYQTTIENIHYTAYRDHFLGQPVNGIRENIGSITEQHVRDFFNANYQAQNFVVSVAGNVNHEQVSAQVQKAFGGLNTQSTLQVANTEQPYFTPSTLFIRDDEMYNLNIGVAFKAPSIKDPEYFALRLIQNILGDYRADKFTGAHLNAPNRQYNTLHTHLGNLPDVQIQKTFYFPYSDTALFGSYLYGNEVFGHQMYYLSQLVLTEMSADLNQVEVFRARNKIYNDLLQQENSSEVALEQAHQVNFLNRRIPRSEFATRLSHMDNKFLQRVIGEHFWDSELATVAWGPTHGMMSFSHYNRPIKRSTLGWYGNMGYLVV